MQQRCKKKAKKPSDKLHSWSRKFVHERGKPALLIAQHSACRLTELQELPVKIRRSIMN